MRIRAAFRYFWPGDPEGAVAVAPDPPGALARHGRFQDSGAAGPEIDLTEVVAGERGKEHLTIRRTGYAIGAGAARRQAARR